MCNGGIAVSLSVFFVRAGEWEAEREGEEDGTGKWRGKEKVNEKEQEKEQEKVEESMSWESESSIVYDYECKYEQCYISSVWKHYNGRACFIF